MLSSGSACNNIRSEEECGNTPLCRWDRKWGCRRDGKTFSFSAVKDEDAESQPDYVGDTWSAESDSSGLTANTGNDPIRSDYGSDQNARLRGSASRNTYLSAVSVSNNPQPQWCQCRPLSRGECMERPDCRWVIVWEWGEQVPRCWPRIEGPCRPRTEAD